VERVTADSNVLISAVRFGGKPLDLLALAVDGEIELAISDGILRETLRILHDKFHTSPERLEQIEGFLSAITTHVYPTERIDAVAADRDDNRVLECAVKAGSRVIISGDQHLLDLGRFNDIEILRVADFLSRFQKSGE